jgi:hypothetical protein
MTGMLTVAGLARSWRQSSTPSMRGIITSSSTMSGARDAMMSSASQPSCAMTHLVALEAQVDLDEPRDVVVVVDDEHPRHQRARRPALGGFLDGPSGLRRVVRREHRRAGDEDVGAGRRADLRGVAVDPAVDLEPQLRPCARIASRASVIFGTHSSMNDWPPNPASTVITSTRSNSGRISMYGASAVLGLSARPALPPAAWIARAVCTGSTAASTWNVTTCAPTST